MHEEKISEKFENGLVTVSALSYDVKSLSWNEHPKFNGVYLKHLIKGEDTGGSLSCHLVKVCPGCTIDTHIHNGKLEIHEVIEGDGICTIGENSINYEVGSIALIPADISHKVVSGSSGIYILAKFSPALL